MTQIVIKYEGALSTTCTHKESGERIRTEAPKDNLGSGQAFSPTDLFAASLGSCVLTLMGIHARHLGIEFKDVKAEVTKEMSTVPPRRIARLAVRVTSSQEYTQEVRDKLEHAGKHCPVAASLHPGIQVEYLFQWGSL